MMPGKLLWGDIMELEAPLEETESQRKERQKVRWMGRASFWAAPAWAGRGAVSDLMACQNLAGASQGLPSRSRRPS